MDPAQHEPESASSSESACSRWSKRLGWFVFVYFVLLAVSLPYLIPPVPKTKLGWLVLLVLGPPGYLLAEWLGDKFAEPWGESNALIKAMKAAAFIAVVLVAMVVWVFFTA